MEQKLEKHELNLYPQANEKDFLELVESISKDGFDINNPIVLFDGKIIDGWNRYLASVRAEKRYSTRVFKGTREEALDFIIRTNIRRNLTASQKAALATDYLPLLEEAAKVRQTSGVKVQEKEKGESAERAAQLFDTNKDYVKKAKKLKEENPTEYEKVKSGEKTISQATKKEKPKVDSPKKDKPKSVKIEGAYENAPNNWNLVSGVLAVHLDETLNFQKGFNKFIPNPGKDFLKLWQEYEKLLINLRSWCVDKAGKCTHCHGTTQIKITKDGKPDPNGTPAPCNRCMNGFAGEI